LNSVASSSASNHSFRSGPVPDDDEDEWLELEVLEELLEWLEELLE
jgi:hypothetical protein